MKEVVGDIWDFHDKGHWIVITTNGFVKKTGYAVMGRGVAKQAAIKYPSLPRELGEEIRDIGNRPCYFPEYKILTLPVKHNWWEKANIALIEDGLKKLVAGLFNDPASDEMEKMFKGQTIYMVRPGCGNGGLEWKDVKPICEKYLDDRFVVVYWERKAKRKWDRAKKLK